MSIMPIERIDDWEKRIERQDAFWDCAIIDRPPVMMALPLENPDFPPPPPKQWPSMRERWFDGEYRAAQALSAVMNTEFLGDALPTAHPNLGPEVFSAFFGQELEFSESTSWSVPFLKSWDDADALTISRDNPYWQQLLKITDAYLEAGKGRFYTGVTDLHPGADAIAAFRDPLELNVDMIEHLEDVRRLRERIDAIYAEVFDFWYDKLHAAGQAATCWANLVSTRKWYVPSNDFSCMISKEMFDDVFLPGIAAECRHMQANIYHLDGPDALRHLDSLLSIPELNAIQWIYGAGNGRASDWLEVYQKCQDAGKGVQIYIGVDELDTIMQNLRPEGVWLGLGGVRDREHADALLKKIAAWR